ncbi:MAG: glycosyltransferase [Flavobacteriales bacterium]|nr:glycosyltransferase [Flavobacteriales bacterium]
MKAPILVLAYRRPALLQRTLRSLAANEGARDSAVHIHCDGARNGASAEERRDIEQVQRIAREATGFAAVHVSSAESNKGLARSVIGGVEAMLEKHDRVIVVEDDVELSPYFLRFMNDALEAYGSEERVAAVGSWTYFTAPVKENFFLRYPDSIAWATWRRSWRRFQADGTALKEALSRTDRMRAFDLDGEVSYFPEMLDRQVAGEVDSWAIRWTATNVLNDTLTLFPRQALSKHIGFGAQATHETGSDDYNRELQLATAPVPVESIPVEESAEALENWRSFVRRNFMGTADTSLKARVWRSLPTGLRRWYTRRRTSEGGDTPAQLAFAPVSRVFGIERGTPVDRAYIERFLEKERSTIRGAVMEVGESTYTQRFGQQVERSLVLSYDGPVTTNVINGDLTRHESLPDAIVDAFICTQTLNFIYDVRLAVQGLHRTLKSGGVALVTVAGLVQVSRYDADRWGDFWRFTPQGAQRLFAEVFGKDNVQVDVHGNSYAAACLQKGFAVEECDADLLFDVDPDYPVVITIKARKA